MKASDLRRSLLDAGLEPTEAENLIKARVEAGTVEDDAVSASTESEELVELEKATNAIVESWSEGDDTVTIEAATDELTKSGTGTTDTAEAGISIEIVEQFAKSADGVANAVIGQYDGLAKAVQASSQAVQALYKAVWQMQGELKKSREEIAELNTLLSEPVAPRGQLSVVPAPGDTTEPAITRDVVINKAMAEMRISDSIDRRNVLGRAIAELDTQADPAAVASNYGINLG